MERIRIWTFGSEPFLTQQLRSVMALTGVNLAASHCNFAFWTDWYFDFTLAYLKPVRRITETAVPGKRQSCRSGIRGENELGRLGETNDDMASSLEKTLSERRLTSVICA